MRDRTVLAIVGAAALISALCGGSRRFCDALVARAAMPRRGTVRRARAAGVSGLRATWIDEQVSLEVPASSEDTYSLYSDLRRQPDWSPWLKSVEHDRESGTSKWVIQSNGIKVSWKAKNTAEVYGSEVAWESTTGLSNRGRVTFQDKGKERCLMTLTLSYNLPFVIASVLRLEAVEKFVKRTILSDLSRFKKVLLKQLAERSATSSTAGTDSTAEGTGSLPTGIGSDSGDAADPAAAFTAASTSGPAATDSDAATTVPASTTTTAAVAADDAVTCHLADVAAPSSSLIDAPAPVAVAGAGAAGAAGDPETSVNAVTDGLVSESKGGATSHAPGRRSRWRRRFRRLLRRDRGRDAANDPPPVAAMAEQEARGGAREV
ncbi:unnamed protein product [Scytosiphon promiscuus]